METPFLRSFILKPTERVHGLLKDCARVFQNSPTFEKSACFYVIISGNFERFQYFDFETNFLKNKKPFQKME